MVSTITPDGINGADL